VTQPVNDDNTTITRAVDLPLTPPCYTSFEYNASGIRTKKVHYDSILNKTTTTEYMLDGATVLGEKITSGSEVKYVYYVYNSGELVGMEYDGVPYYYRKNALGDIVEIYNASNTLVGSYKYDAWGNCTVGTNVNNIARYNPFRYRGYYYDTETGYYYLQTRYYDPETGRFINADNIAYLDPETINGCNLYAYCLNNPVMAVDPSGCSAILTFLTILLGAFFIAGATALVVGAISGKRGPELWASVVESALLSVVMTASLVLGGVLWSASAGLFALGLFLVPVGAFGAGMGIYAVKQTILGDSYVMQDAIAYGMATGFQAGFNFVIGAGLASVGLYNPLAKGPKLSSYFKSGRIGDGLKKFTLDKIVNLKASAPVKISTKVFCLPWTIMRNLLEDM